MFTKDRKSPWPIVDMMIEKDGKIVLIRRVHGPFEGQYALPGGFVELGETVEDAAVRETKEETGLDVMLVGIVGVYSHPERDPRGGTVSTLFACEVVGGDLVGGDDARDAEWVDIEKAKDLDLSFDHNKMVADYMKWKETKGTFWSSK